MTFTVYYSLARDRRSPLHAKLAQVGLEDFRAAAAAAARAGPTLKQLLAPEEAAGALTRRRRRRPNRASRCSPATCSRPAAPTVNPAHEDTLEHVAAALNKVPGRVMVDGAHRRSADPIAARSATTTSCRASAPSASATILQRTLDRAAAADVARRRLVAAAVSSGVGSGEPRAEPPRGNHPSAGQVTSDEAGHVRLSQAHVRRPRSGFLLIASSSGSRAATSRSPTIGRSRPESARLIAIRRHRRLLAASPRLLKRLRAFRASDRCWRPSSRSRNRKPSRRCPRPKS